MKTSIVSVDYLKAHIDDPEIIILHVHLKAAQGDFENVQIKNARFFDLKNIFKDQESQWPNTCPSAEYFEEKCRQLGINKSSKIIVYDSQGIYASPRAWWIFKTMGHENIVVLDGGLPAWIESNGQTEKVNEKQAFNHGNFVANYMSEKMRNIEFVKENLNSKNNLLIDARSAGRFDGIAPEPRKGLRGGHIPNSINIPFTEVLENGFLKNKSELVEVFKAVDLSDSTFTFSCGSGITACIVLLAMEQISDQQKSVFDGSWTAWGTSVEVE